MFSRLGFDKSLELKSKDEHHFPKRYFLIWDLDDGEATFKTPDTNCCSGRVKICRLSSLEKRIDGLSLLCLLK